ncbi:MAG TPA: glucose-1-phosphate adenylyltransferase [Candidatus Omnitrophota bacterium]|nr:glucose-1-phosphate adenylyltransferase [Candidatus Omnitrophota bacterium]
MTNDVLCVILGGGRGTRLFPLTRDRAKPAVPLFGKYRLIDIPISNCLNSGLNRINILTQFNSESLNKHIVRTYKFDQFSKGFIEIIAADQAMDNTDWFQGPADAVRKSLKHFVDPGIKHVCILSGDQLYKMDLKPFLEYHLEKKADVTVACNLIEAEDVSSFGIASIDPGMRIKEFVEKPAFGESLRRLAVKRAGSEKYLCSMGIYFFTIEALKDCLTKSGKPDFGKEIIPQAVSEKKVFAYEFDGYWRDIGTIKAFYAENINMTAQNAPLDLFDETWPIFTRSRSLPPSKIIDSKIENSIVADGSIISSCSLKNSIVGLRSRIHSGSIVENSIIMGADYFETEEQLKNNLKSNKTAIGIGKNCIIKKAILDKNARIGDNVKIVNAKGVENHEDKDYLIRDGIVIIYKNAAIPSGTTI